MLKHLPIKKEYLLIIASTLFFLISYQFAIKKTIEAWQINKSLKAQIERAGDLSVQPAYLERKINNLSKLISRYKVDTISLRNNTLSILSSVAEKDNVKLSEVPIQDPQYSTNRFIIQKVSFEGDFFSLNEVCNQLQEKTNIGMLRSTTYTSLTKRDQTAKDPKLIMDIYLESIK